MAGVERVVKHAVFTYTDADGIYRTALRGETITVEGEDLARGERFDVFFDDEEPAVTSSPLDEALVGDDEDLSLDVEALVAALSPEQRQELVDALVVDALVDSPLSSPAGAVTTEAELAAAAVAEAELSSTGVVGQSSTAEIGERPKLTESKATWLAYRGLSDLPETQAEQVTKAQLQDDEFMASYRRPAVAPGA